MKKIIKLTENDLVRIVKRVINEDLGISEDAEKLCKLLMDNIGKLSSESEITIKSEDLYPISDRCFRISIKKIDFST